MKKVLVLVAAMLLVAANAMAFSSVLNSKHNMQSNAAFVTGTTEICVFCHTPHGADVSNANAPLWNRTNVDATTYYNSATLNTLSKGAGVVSVIANSDAPLCLSCHDNQSVVEPLLNAPNGTTLSWTPMTWDTALGANANIGSALSNDHPIGMNYAAVAASASDTGMFVTNPSGITFYAGNKMWCSSCHDVHDDSNYPFLVQSNAASALCLACHIK